MNEENIRKYAGLMAELGLTGMEITEDNCRVRLERNVPLSAVPPVYSVPAAAQAVQPAKKDASAASDSGDAVCSPMVGIYYSAPAENASDFVSVGSHVKKGDTLCIIEAMKLMNEVVAERDGVVSEICVENGAVVEYGTVLFRIGGE